MVAFCPISALSAQAALPLLPLVADEAAAGFAALLVAAPGKPAQDVWGEQERTNANAADKAGAPDLAAIASLSGLFAEATAGSSAIPLAEPGKPAQDDPRGRERRKAIAGGDADTPYLAALAAVSGLLAPPPICRDAACERLNLEEAQSDGIGQTAAIGQPPLNPARLPVTIAAKVVKPAETGSQPFTDPGLAATAEATTNLGGAAPSGIPRVAPLPEPPDPVAADSKPFASAAPGASNEEATQTVARDPAETSIDRYPSLRGRMHLPLPDKATEEPNADAILLQTAKPESLASSLGAATPQHTAILRAQEIAPTASANSIDTVANRQLDMARGDIWLDQLAREIVSMSDRENRLSFRLMPRALGQLDIDLKPAAPGLSIHMHAASEDARAIVAAAQPRLVADIRAQGVRVADASVGSGTSQNSGQNAAPGQRPPLIEIAPQRPGPLHEIEDRSPRKGRFA